MKKTVDFFRDLWFNTNTMNDMKDTIFTVTFTNGSSVFIQATDDKHARRIVERNGATWTRGDDKVEMTIDKIEEAKN